MVSSMLVGIGLREFNQSSVTIYSVETSSIRLIVLVP